MPKKLIAALLLLLLLQSQAFPAQPALEVTGTGAVPARVEPNFAHPALKCMARFDNINEYPVMAWCIAGGPGGIGYKYKMAHMAQDIGFNTLIANPQMIRSVSQFDRMMLVIVAIGNNPNELRIKLTGRKDETEPQKEYDLGMKNFGQHSRLIGAILAHNSTVESTMQSAKWLETNYPKLVPYPAANVNPGQQVGTPYCVLGTQNFSIKRTTSVVDYCSKLNFDRDFGNDSNMTFWPMFHAPCSDSKYRFQVYSALAYGAQGIICFAYIPNDKHPEWLPNGRLFKSAQPIHKYVREVVGHHLWGCRSMEVYHSSQDSVPRGNPQAMPGKVVEQLDRNMLVSVLSPEADALNWDKQSAPMYAMAVDKRNMAQDDIDKSGSDLPVRDAVLQFSQAVSSVEVLEPLEQNPAGLRHIEPGCCVTLSLAGGDGRLLRCNPPDLDKLFGKGAADYQQAVVKLGTLVHGKGKLSQQDAAALAAEISAHLTAVDADAPDGDAGSEIRLNVQRVNKALDSITQGK